MRAADYFSFLLRPRRARTRTKDRQLGDRKGAQAESMMEQDELAGLLHATALGDRAAFARLYELTAPRLLGAAVHMLRHRELAEDVLQDLFVKVWHRASEYHAERGSVLALERAQPGPPAALLRVGKEDRVHLDQHWSAEPPEI